jgi:hypothetical protein
LPNFRASQGEAEGPALLDDDRLGTIKEGKLADLAVLSDHLLKVSDNKLGKVSADINATGWQDPRQGGQLIFVTS